MRFINALVPLCSNSLDIGTLSVPRLDDALAERNNAEIEAAAREPAETMSYAERRANPEGWLWMRRLRRKRLEAFLWTTPNSGLMLTMANLIALICEESAWCLSGASEDPAHPDIDAFAAETGALLAWVLHKHGAKLEELDPKLAALMRAELRRRLLAPAAAFEDYAFYREGTGCAALILSELVLTAVLSDLRGQRRQQLMKAALRRLDDLCQAPGDPFATVGERLADACGVADLARFIKRLTRGEIDLTREYPRSNRLDDLIIPWIGGEYFFDPCGDGLCPKISALDVFRLGYLSGDEALVAIGTQLLSLRDRPCASVTGRVLGMEYCRTARERRYRPPRIRRAASENNSMMMVRTERLYAAIAGTGTRANAGDIAVFMDGKPVVADAGGIVHNLPLIDGRLPALRPEAALPCSAQFSDERDMMNVDLTEIYDADSGVAGYQRTLIASRADDVIRLVEAFDFKKVIDAVTFRFVSAGYPTHTGNEVRLGELSLCYDGDMEVRTQDFIDADELPGLCWLVTLTLKKPPMRLIVGFTFSETE